MCHDATLGILPPLLLCHPSSSRLPHGRGLWPPLQFWLRLELWWEDRLVATYFETLTYCNIDIPISLAASPVILKGEGTKLDVSGMPARVLHLRIVTFRNLWFFLALTPGVSKSHHLFLTVDTSSAKKYSLLLSPNVKLLSVSVPMQDPVSSQCNVRAHWMLLTDVDVIRSWSFHKITQITNCSRTHLHSHWSAERYWRGGRHIPGKSQKEREIQKFVVS